jgi:peptidoglycan-associated lipoprotein
MQRRQSLYVAALFSVAMLMTAGCATQAVVKTDDGIGSASGTKQADQPKSGVTPPTQTAPQAAAAPVSQAAPAQATAAAKPVQKIPSTSQLQSALEKIYFDFDSSALSETARSTLAKNAALLIKEPSARIRIEGNCDERGSAEYNLALGERRAASAQQYLTTLGVRTERLSTISYGKEKPAEQGSSEAAMTKNRRDEFVVINR